MLGNCALKRGDKASCEKSWNVARQDVMFRSWLLVFGRIPVSVQVLGV
jgi:hypothetical protein